MNSLENLKEKNNAVILAHNYQIPEVQDIADFCGDSLGLSRKAADTDKDVIVFCGVDFMAETAKILSPEKKVLLPVEDATCPMAEMITPREIRDIRKEYPGAAVVTYVNTTADVKAESDICCTSSNAVKVVNSLKEERVIFIPDRNLADYVSRHTEKEIIPWEGFCLVHDNLRKGDVEKAKSENPGAVFMAHPECRREVLELADFICSTGGMFDVVRKNEGKNKFLVGTEAGMIYPLKREFPDREFIPVSESMICSNMKKTNLEKVKKSLLSAEDSDGVQVPGEVLSSARKALYRMLEIV